MANKRWWRSLGPGLVTGAADDDPSGIGTYSIAGAQFGYGLLWLVPFCYPLMVVVQEMCGRIAAVCHQGLAAVIKAHYPRWLLWGTISILVIANTINVWADLNIMAASMTMLSGLPWTMCLTLIAAVCVLLQVFVPYRIYVKYLKWLCLALLAYVVTALLPSVHQDWGQIARHLVRPHFSLETAFIMTVVGFVGTTISPYLFFWQASETVEERIAEGKSRPQSKAKNDAEIVIIRGDTAVGMLYSQIMVFFIIICTSATLHAKGVTHLDTAQQAAEALRPLGHGAFWLFSLGIVGTGLLAIPTLAGSAAYAVAEAAEWRHGLYRRFGRAQGFYLTIAAVTLIGYLLNFVKSVSPVQALLYSAVMNGVAAPPLIVVLLMICNNPKIVREHKNGWLSNVLGVITVIVMSAAATVLFWAIATRHI